LKKELYRSKGRVHVIFSLNIHYIVKIFVLHIFLCNLSIDLCRAPSATWKSKRRCRIR